MSRKLSYSCQGLSNGRCPWLCALPCIRHGVSGEIRPDASVAYILAWASALPSDMNRAMREASGCRTVTGTDSYAFLFFTVNANEGMTAALTIFNEVNLNLW